MKKAFVVFILGVALLTTGCGTSSIDYSSPEAFIKDFVDVLSTGKSGRFEAFYLQESDFNAEAPGIELARKRFLGVIREQFLKRCAGAAAFMEGKQVEVGEITLPEGIQRVSMFLSDVTAKHAGVVAYLLVDDQPARLEIEELVKVKDAWRITRFTMIVEEEVEWGGEIEIDASDIQTRSVTVEEDEEAEDGQEEP